MTYDQSLEEPCYEEYDDDAYEQAQDAKRCEQEFERRFNAEKP